MPCHNCSEQYQATPWLRETGCEGSLGAFESGKVSVLGGQAVWKPSTQLSSRDRQMVLQYQREQLMGVHLPPALPAKVLLTLSYPLPTVPLQKNIHAQRKTG